MKRTVPILSALVFFTVLFSGISLAQEVDLSGTWEGTTEVPDSIEPDAVALVLEKTNSGYSGTVTDMMGLVQNEEIEDVEFKDNTLTFNIPVWTGEVYLKVYLTLTVEGDTMSGYWESEDGSSAPVELKRVKK